jgi:alpha-mannosidase
MGMTEAKPRMSRRTMLKSSLALLSSLWLSRFVKTSRASSKAWDLSPKRIYIAPDDHTDYLWVANEAEYKQAFLDMIDYYLNLADSTANEPNADFKSRWHCDGTFWLWTYAKNRTTAQFNRLIQRIQDGSFSVPLQPLCQVLGGTPAEAVLRGMYYAGQIERRYGLRFSLAYSMENQTLPFGLGALWAGSGAKYSWKGICGCATKVASPGNRLYDIYWWNGPDGSRLLMKWDSMLTGNQGMGGYAEAYNPSTVVDYVDGNDAFKAKYAYAVIGAFGRGWDAVKTLTNAFPTVAKAKTNAARRVIVSNEIDFFQDFEATYGASLPQQACSFGNEWDLLCASMAEVSARVKRAVEKLRSAEALAVLVAAQNPSFMNGRNTARDQAWMDLGLYWEHDWTGDSPIAGMRDLRAAWQKRLAAEIESYVNQLQADAARSLAGMIQKTGANIRFYAFNPLSWSRSDIADISYTGATPVHVIEVASNQEVPSQIVTLAGQKFVRILASNVPAVGYKVYEIQPGAGAAFPDAPSVNGGVIENDLYRLTVASNGAITSLIDKTRGNTEFAKNVGGLTINDLGSGTGSSLLAENVGPVSATVLATVTTSSPLKHTSRVTLIRGLNRIAIQNDINQNFSSLNTWSFAFNLNTPDVWHEEVGAMVRAKLTTATPAGHYSPQNARYDWLTLNHLADMSGGGQGVTLSNADCYFMQLGASTPANLDVTTPQIRVLAGGQVDGPSLGMLNQGGDTHFLQRFALQTHDAYDAATAMRFALEHQNPLVTAVITGGTQYPEKTFSFLTLSNPNLLLWALKPAEDWGIPRNFILRLWNFSEAAADFSLQLSAGPITTAKRTTHIETPLGEASVVSGSLQGSLAAHQISTYAVTTDQPLGKRVWLPVSTRRSK